MVDSIKITALQDIGANIAYTTLVPVVNMAGTPTTQKANLQNLGNLILNGAGGSYFARAAQANLALSVSNAAQPNITSVGTLTSLVVTGNIRAGNANLGNIATANFYYGDGGFLTNVAANGSYSNSNVANYLPTFTGIVGANTIRSTASSGSNVQINANGAVFLFGQGGALYWPTVGGQQKVIETNIDNEFEIKSTTNVVISTDVSNANLHFTFASDGVVYCPANANFEGTRLNVGPGAGNVNLATNPTLVVTDDGGEFIQAAILNSNPNGSSDYAAYGADSSETEGFADLGFSGPTFNDPNYTITEPGDGYVLAQGYANGIGGGLVLATGENGNVPDIVFATGGFLANAEFARIDHANDVFHLTRAGAGIKYPDGSIQTTAAGAGGLPLANGTSNINIAAANGNATVGVAGEYTWTFDTTGNVTIPGDIIGTSTIDIDNRASGNTADINLYSADDITLQARDRPIGATAEGGDINIFAGDSAEDSDTSAGDIVIEAGDGGASNIDFGGSGGFIRIEAGAGGAASTQIIGESARSGGSLTLTAGDAGTNNGNIFRGSSGGDVTINAGDSTGNGEPGGEIILNAGIAGANALAGRVQINIPSSDNGNGGTWTFDGTGNLTLPNNTWSVNYANGTQVPLGGAALGNVTFDDVTVQGDNSELNLSAGPDYTANLAYLQVRAGDVASHIHFDTGNSEAYDLIIGNDQKFVQVSSTGNIIMSSYDNATFPYAMTLDTTGNLTIPGDIKSITTGFSFTANIANVDTTTLANSAVIILANGVFGGPSTGQVTITGVVGTTEANGTWYFEAVEADAFQLYYDEALQNPVDGTGWPAYVSGGLAVAAGYNNLSITGGNVTIINNNSDAWSFNSDGSTIYPTLTVTRGDRTGTLTGQTLLFGDSTQEAIITTPNGTNDINASQRFVINPGAGAANTTGEGGDIYLYAGRGGDAGGSGGDIKIRGGLGPVNGQGGYLDIQGGDTQGNGLGGFINIRGGQSANSAGGEVNLYGGYGQTDGGNITITGGQSGNSLSQYGNVSITSGASTWAFNNAGNLVLPTISLGSGVDEQAIIGSQRKLIPPLRYSAVIDADTPTIVYTATNVDTTSMKVAIQIQHTGLGFEFFEVFATFTGSDTYYTVGSRVAPPTIDPSTVVVGLTGTPAMKITVTINSGAATSWVTYDATEFGIAVD